MQQFTGRMKILGTVWSLAALATIASCSHSVKPLPSSGKKQVLSPKLQFCMKEMVTDIAISASGRLVAGSGHKGSIFLWDMRTGRLIRILKAHKDQVFKVAFSPDGSLMASCDCGDNLMLWDIRTGKLLLRTKGAMWGLAFSPKGDLLIGRNEDAINIWKVHPWRLIKTIRSPIDVVSGIAVSRDGRLVVSADGKGKKLTIWNIYTGKVERTFAKIGSRCFGFSPDGLHLASVGGHNTVKLWNISKSRLPVFTTKYGEIGVVSSLAFSPDGKMIAIAVRVRGEDGYKLWHSGGLVILQDAATGNVLQVIRIKNPVEDVVFFRDSKTLAASIASFGKINVYRVDGIITENQ